MADLKQFSKRIRKLGANVEVNANRNTIALGGAVVQTITLATPVDEGTARGNWFASLGFPVRSADLESKDKSGAATISEANSVMKARLPNIPIYITNNLPYIKRLNEGWSAQAPAGFVQKAVRVARAEIKKMKLLK